MIRNILPHSLPVRAGIAIVAITILWLTSTFSSGLLAWVSESDAKAVNVAGSLRMATYRINYLMEDEQIAGQITEQRNASGNTGSIAPSDKTTGLITDMESRLETLRTYQESRSNPQEAINQQLDRIDRQWQSYLKPALLAQDKAAFYSASLPYIDDVDDFVSQLQYRNEKRQNMQQMIQVISLILAIIIMLIGMSELRRNVLRPVQKLIDANKRFKQGKLDTSVKIYGYREFQDLGSSFNDMARTIASHQRSLETEVRVKTQHLVKANQALSLLYDFAQHLTTSQVSLHKLDSLIVDFGEILPYLDFTLCIQNEVLNNQDSIALHSNEMQELCSKLACEGCSIKNHIHTKSYPIAQQKTQFGELRVTPKPKDMVSAAVGESLFEEGALSSQRIQTVESRVSAVMEENHELIIALTNLISTALSMRKQRQQEHQLILFEERSTMARELHDSLAQSLSYLKIQVSMLEKHLGQLTAEELTIPATSNAAPVDKAPDIRQAIGQIKTGLNAAYQELRELLVTFRLTINNDSFDEALHEAANEFALRGHFAVSVDNKVMSLGLSAAEQVDLIQIAREALANVSRHAQAQNVTVSLGYDKDQTQIIMNIADDGIGIRDSGSVDQTQHHGLMIMKERAHNLGGTFTVKRNTPKGTLVTVVFSPDFFAKSSHKDA